VSVSPAARAAARDTYPRQLRAAAGGLIDCRRACRERPASATGYHQPGAVADRGGAHPRARAVGECGRRRAVHRASPSPRDFEPIDDEREAIDDVCARLDRMPLAIELAAARVGVFGPRELAQRLERPLDVLTRGDRDAPERQRSLRASTDWTHALLASEQQSLFARLGVCAGTVPLEFIEALSVCGPGAGTIDALDELLACSFVRRRNDRPSAPALSSRRPFATTRSSASSRAPRSQRSAGYTPSRSNTSPTARGCGNGAHPHRIGWPCWR
jgi:predicted ATPase